MESQRRPAARRLWAAGRRSALPLQLRRYLALAAFISAHGTHTNYSLAWLLRSACRSFCISSGVSFGRSIVSVNLLSLPVKANGTW